MMILRRVATFNLGQEANNSITDKRVSILIPDVNSVFRNDGLIKGYFDVVQIG